ncbi:MAG: glutathione S-transferase family protein [Alphaproteobacteria bacterium]|nr:MAG: glutathione S-transferase family protein [Alphaproteobacteria bacterium]
MADMILVIGNRNYSSWSLRPWLAMKANGLVFDELLIPLDTPDFPRQVAAYGAAGRVPILVDGGMTVWDSLAIVEHLAERFPDRSHWWPQQPRLRSHARATVAEMHSGFAAVRSEMPMNLKRAHGAIELSPAARREVARIEAVWGEALAISGGPWLYGDFSIADAFYAPVATRFATYAVSLGEAAHAYVERIHAHPDFAAWHAAALEEPWALAADAI